MKSGGKRGTQDRQLLVMLRPRKIYAYQAQRNAHNDVTPSGFKRVSGHPTTSLWKLSTRFSSHSHPIVAQDFVPNLKPERLLTT